MTTEKHYSYFKVENFKGFESLEVKNIGQFNLIGGDNNVGKTSLLEALLFDEKIKTYSRRLANVFDKKNSKIKVTDVSFVDFFLKNRANRTIKYIIGRNRPDLDASLFTVTIKESDELNGIEIEKLKNRGLFTNENLKTKSIVIMDIDSVITDVRFLMDINDGEKYLPIIFCNLGYADDLIKFYSDSVQQSVSRKNEFIQNLRQFVEKVINVEVVNEYGVVNLKLQIENNDDLMPLSFFGEGSIKLFRILLEIYECEGQFLLIDEIDAGIHYSRFKAYWRVILRSAIQYNVQLFATTHSIECMRYYKEVLEEPEFQEYSKDARYIVLVRNKEDNPQSFTYTFPEFASNMDIPNEMR